MIRFAWLQFRLQAAATAAVLTVAAPPGSRGSCAVPSGLAGAAFRTRTSAYFSFGRVLGYAVYAVPALAGMFWGAPLAARELAAGTHRLAWTQTITRTRWLTVKLAVAGAASMIAAGLFSFMVTWWNSPLDSVSGNRFTPAVGLTACAATAASSRRPPTAARQGFADALLDAFTTHRLVALGAADSLQNHYDVLGLLLADPRLPGVVDDIIIEWGNPLYQATIDRFTAGQPVADVSLRAVWRNTTQSPLETWDAPVYEQFYRLIRAVNWTLPASKQIRVLAGDSPIDWTTITSVGQLRAMPPRDAFVTSLVQEQVLSRGRRALLCYGMTGLFHGTGMTGAIEQATGQKIYVIAALVPLAGDPGGLAAKLSRYPRNTVIPAVGTWLGSFNAGQFVAETQGTQASATTASPQVHGSGPSPQAAAGGAPHAQTGNPFCGVPLGSLIDAGLYPGQPAELTQTWPDPDIYFNPGYWAELQRRNALKGNTVNLTSYRQDHPAPYLLSTLAPSQRCR